MRNGSSIFTLACLWLLLGGFAAPPVHAAAVPARAAVASAQPLATAAGREILEAGGNAFDAAIAVSAALAVVEPYSSGLGGGGFYLLHRASDGHEVMLDARERAPLAASAGMYLDTGGRVVPGLSMDGVLAAAIPGVPAALDWLARRYGRLPLYESLAPAIRLAHQGFPVSPRYRRMASFRLELLRRHPGSAHFLDQGRVPELGHGIRQPQLAVTLSTIAALGARGFYRGALARRLVQGVRAAGGIWTSRDLAEYRVIERRPVVTHYHDIRIVSAAPPSSGGVVLGETLNILSGFDLARLAPIQRKQRIIEALRRAYRDRAAYLGDPDFVAMPLRRLLNPAYADRLRAGIRPGRATPSSELPAIGISTGQGSDTTHFSILDREGNRVAATLSINYPFGSGFVVPGTGVLLNDEMDDFSARPLTPNAYGLVGDAANRIQGGKRPLSSMTPTFLEAPGRIGIIGTPGGSRIISMVLLGVLDFAAGHGPASWVSLPRFHHQYLPDQVQYESGGLSVDEIRALEAMGYTLKDKGRRYGNMQAILWHTGTGEVQAASDPRGEGRSLVFAPR